MEEVWKFISNHKLPISYEVSSMGNVRNNFGTWQEEIHQFINKNGLSAVSIKSKLLIVHRLVAEEFIPNPNNFKFVIHKDGNRQNNTVDNLMWSATSTITEARSFRAKTWKCVRCINTGIIYNSRSTAQLCTGIPTSLIDESCTTFEPRFGLQFEYVDPGSEDIADKDIIHISSETLKECSRNMNSIEEFWKEINN